MNKHFELEDVGQTKYIIVRNSFSSKEESEDFWLTFRSDTKERCMNRNYPTDIRLTNFEKTYCMDKLAKKTKQYSIYRLLELKDLWNKELLKIIRHYTQKKDVPMRSVIENCYTEVKRQKSYKYHLLCFRINNEKRLNMYEIMTKILFPIEEIKGDLTTMYYYKDKYIIIREFIHNRIYVMDCFTEKYRDILWSEFKVENKHCNLHINFIQQNSDYYKAVSIADEERIKIILNRNASAEKKAIAKGIR